MKTMNKQAHILFSLLTTFFIPLGLSAQEKNDSSLIDRNVTVEREFQPVIQHAGKIDTQPDVIYINATPHTPTYSFYSNEVVNTDFNFNQIGYATTNFTHAKPLRGFLRGAFGHVATMADFSYRLTERRDIIFDINANHLAQWGMKTMSHTQLGFDFSKLFENTDLYFGASGKNIYFTRYGRYFNYTDPDKALGNFSGLRYRDLSSDDKDSQWEVYTRLGVRSLPGSDLRYKVQTGYEAFIMKQGYIEHIINSEALFSYQLNDHLFGVEAQVQNHLNKADMSGFNWRQSNRQSGDTVANNYHAIKAEPYYAYNGNRFSIHAGVNLDFCMGKQKVFLPSPNVTFEAKLTKDWLALYGGAVGDWRTSSVREHFQIVRYVHAENELATSQNRTYIPVDAFLGFKIRPHQDLLIDLYAHYQLTKYDVFLIPDKDGFFNVTGSDHDCWKIGGKIYYHYQDMIAVTLDGHYNIRHMYTGNNPFFNQDLYQMGLKKNTAIDRDVWNINLRIDYKINRKLTIYSANYFAGKHYALAPDNTWTGSKEVVQAYKIMTLKPTIDLNLGVEYNFNRWFSTFFQLNNFLHRKHDVYYGYQTQGINFLAGVSWTF